MEFELLGPLRVVEGDLDLTPARPKQRALLAMLLLHREKVVPGAQLIEALWGEEPPESAQTALHGHVSALRKLIGADRIRTRPPGYLLQVSADEVDLARFELLVAQARERDDPQERSSCLREALALWRGEPLAELRYQAFAEREIARLEELRLAAIEDRVDADLALGRHHELVPELEPLVAEHAFRERVRGQLMLALYRCDRQADALHVFQSGRRALVEELGIDPGPALQQLELRILRQDSSLDLPAGDGYPAAQSAPAVEMPVRRRPPVRYARSGDLSIAYQVTGDGPIDVVLVPGSVSHLEKDWEEPRHARFLERLGSIARLIRFDKRGTGLSDRPPGVPDLESRMDDVRAVMDAAGSERAVLFGYSEGAPMAILFAAAYPDRARALVLYGAYAKRLDPDDDYPWAPTREARAAYAARVRADWGFESHMKIMCPSADEAMGRWWGERSRAAASPGAIKALIEMNSLVDVRALLPTVHVPTLVVHRGTDYHVKVEEGRYIAERIPGARFVELPGADHFVAVDPDQILDAVEPFLIECGAARLPAREDRALVTLLVTDIAGSARAAAELGDRARVDLIERHHEVVRAELTRFRGREVDASGDRTLATFDGPARAVRCATAIVRALRLLGLGIRAGVHTGEVEVDGDRVHGVAVHIASRVAAEAAPDEVLVSQTVTDLVAGSGLEFADRGSRALAGVPGEWRLLAVVDSDRGGADAPLPTAVPFVGRLGELEQLETALAASDSGRGSVVLVGGDAGIGKSRLIAEFAERARRAGAQVLRGGCIDLVGPALPFSPVVELLRSVQRSALEALPRPLLQLPRLLPDLAALDPAVAGERRGIESQLGLFEEVSMLLEHVSRSAPLVLVLEDLHWADSSTRDLVSYVTHHVPDRRIVLVLTYRTDELLPAHPLYPLLASLARGESVLSLPLEPLESRELEQLVAAVSGDGLAAPLRAEIVARSEGNPFLAEVLADAAREGESGLPAGLRDLLLVRIARLGEAPRSALRVVAAAGREVTYPLLAAIVPLAEEELFEALRETVDHQVLVADAAGGRYRFRHALYAEAVYATLLPGERERLHERIAEALAADPGLAATHAVTGELAHHWAAAGRPVEALVASVQAARDAEAVSGLAEARRHAERVVELWEKVPNAGERCGLDLPAALAWCAELTHWTGEPARAAELALLAIDALEADGEALRSALLYERLGTYLLPAGDPAGALAAFKRAVEAVPATPPSPERVRVLAALGNALMLSWRHADSLPVCQEAIAVSHEIGDDRPALRAMSVLGVDLCYLGRLDEGLACLEDARARAEDHGLPTDVTHVHATLSDVWTMAGRLQVGARVALEGLASARRLGLERSHGSVLAANAAEALLGLGDWARAESVLTEAMHAGGTYWPHQPLTWQAALEIGRGELDAARAHLETAREAAEEPRSAASFALHLAELALWEGQPAAAAAAVQSGLRGADSDERAFLRAHLCALGLRAEAERAELASIRQDPSALQQARERGRELLLEARSAAQKAAEVTPDAAAWCAVAEAEANRLEDHPEPKRWEIAVAAWDELGRPYLAAYCRWRQAESLLAAGASSRDAAEPARAAHRVARWLGAGPLRHQLELLAQRSRLDLIEPPGAGEGGHETTLAEGLGLTPR